jgi:long-chain acyl-CoA synthetase
MMGSLPDAETHRGRSGGLDTFPKMLLEHAWLRPERPAMREKEYGIWQSWSRDRGAHRRVQGPRARARQQVGDHRRQTSSRLYWAIAGGSGQSHAN